MCGYTKKTWIEKRDIHKDPAVKKLDVDFADMKKGEKMLIANPAIVEEYIRHITKGKEGSLAQMRKDLAATYHADKTYPVTAGIFLRIVAEAAYEEAEAAYEEYEKGKTTSKISPFRRMISPGSAAAKKLSFAIDFLITQRKKEHLPF